MAATTPDLMSQFKNIIRTGHIEDAIKFVEENGEWLKEITRNHISNIMAYLDRVYLDIDALMELWVMESTLYSNYLQWLPKEMLEDIVNIEIELFLKLFGLLIQYGVVDVNAKDSDSKTPLHYAVHHNNLYIARLLLKNGADVNPKDMDDRTPLHYAVSGNNWGIACLLLENGADINAKNRYYGHTPLHNAVSGNNWDIARLLLEKGANLNAEDSNILLPAAVSSNHLNMARLLLEKGAHVNAKDMVDDTPLHIAVSSNHLNMARLLLEKGAHVNVKNVYKHTPLRKAIADNKLDMAGLLLRHGAEVIEKDPYEYGPDILDDLAEHNKDGSMARLLLESKAGIIQSKEEINRRLQLAATNGNEPMARLLLEIGADIDSKDNKGNTPLVLALKQKNDVIAKLLLERGADINMKNQRGETALHVAASKGNKILASLLVEKSADVNAKDKDGQTAHDLWDTKFPFDKEMGNLLRNTTAAAPVQSAPHLSSNDSSILSGNPSLPVSSNRNSVFSRSNNNPQDEEAQSENSLAIKRMIS